MQQVAIALIIGSAINLTFSLILIQFYGLAGIAIATVIASVVIDLIAMPFMLQRILGLTVIAFVRNSCMRPLIAGLLQAILMISIRYMGPAENFVYLSLQGMLAVAASIVVLITIGLTRDDQQRFLVGPLRRLGKKMTVDVTDP